VSSGLCSQNKFRGCGYSGSQDTGWIVQMFDNLVGCKAITSNFEFSEIGKPDLEIPLQIDKLTQFN